MKNFSYSPIDRLIKKALIIFWGVIATLFLGINFAFASENTVKMVFTSGRAIIVDGKKEIAKKMKIIEIMI